MERKVLVYPLLLLTLFFILPVFAQTPNLCSYRGYANKSGTLVNTTDTISVIGTNKLYNATIFTDGSYTLDVEAEANTNITFQIDGVNVAQGYRTFSCPSDTLVTQNLSITLLSDSSSCSYSLACSGGYCCSGATQISGGAGSGTCQSSVCTATTTTAAAGGGGGGGGAATTTTTTTTSTTTTTVPATTTTTLPPVVETEVIESIEAGETAEIIPEDPDDLKIEKVEITVKNKVSDVEVTITKTSTAPATVAIAAPDNVFAYFRIEKDNIADTDIESVKIKFKVEKSWISENNVDKSTITLKKYVNGEWVDMPTVLVSEDATYVYFESELPGLSVYAISGKELAVTTTTVPTTTTTVAPPSRLRVVIPLVLALLVIVVVAVFFYSAYRKK